MREATPRFPNHMYFDDACGFHLDDTYSAQFDGAQVRTISSVIVEYGLEQRIDLLKETTYMLCVGVYMYMQIQ